MNRQASHYPIPARAITIETEIKRSRFVTDIAQASNREEAVHFIEQIRKMHPEARHHCWAYIAGHPESSIERACSDAGEPSGTAGKPMLNVLQHKGIGEIVVVVSRYFGGIKLGAGGLVRAYAGAVQTGIDHLPLTRKVITRAAEITLPFALESTVRRLLERMQLSISGCRYGDCVHLHIDIELGQEEAVKEALTEASLGAAKLHLPKAL